MSAFTPNLNMEIRSREEMRRETLHHYRNEAAAAQLEADRRNLELLKGDARMVRMLRAYFITDEFGRDSMASLANALMAEAIAKADGAEAACES